ncbi:MAG: CvpA family protein [Dehalococcoidia bacterium]|nr:CvpA family protein [Dehalococcoidia bacterium]
MLWFSPSNLSCPGKFCHLPPRHGQTGSPARTLQRCAYRALGFFVTLAGVSIALHFVFLLPGKFLQTVVFEGFLLRLLGGALGFFQAAIGLVVVALLVYAYPITEWLKQAVVN